MAAKIILIVSLMVQLVAGTATVVGVSLMNKKGYYDVTSNDRHDEVHRDVLRHQDVPADWHESHYDEELSSDKSLDTLKPLAWQISENEVSKISLIEQKGVFSDPHPESPRSVLRHQDVPSAWLEAHYHDHVSLIEQTVELHAGPWTKGAPWAASSEKTMESRPRLESEIPSDYAEAVYTDEHHHEL